MLTNVDENRIAISRASILFAFAHISRNRREQSRNMANDEFVFMKWRGGGGVGNQTYLLQLLFALRQNEQ